MSDSPRDQPITGDLRGMLLALSPAELGFAPDRRSVWAVLMETGLEKATSSLVVIADGTVSLYFSTGGGIIGAGEHARVRAAADAFLDAVDRALDLLDPADDLPLPGKGEVRFNVLTFDGRLSAAAREDDLGYGRHPLSDAFHAGHEVIGQVRILSRDR